MAYKEKECPKCGVKHTKRGVYCSRSCGNQKSHTADAKNKIAEAKKEWHATSDTAAVVVHNFVSQGLHKTPDPVAPPVATPVGHNQFIADGDLWTEV